MVAHNGDGKISIAPGDDPGVWRMLQDIADASFTRADLEAAVAEHRAGNWNQNHLRRCHEVAKGIFMVDLFDAGGGPGVPGGMSSKWLCYRARPR